MALVLDDRVQETTTTTGTGTLTLAGAVTGYQSFAAIGNGNTTYYCITDGTNWETGLGTYTASGTTLARTTVIESSNSNSLVNFPAGSKNVFVTYPASQAVLLNAAQTLTNKTLTTPNIDSAQFATVSGTAPIYPCRAWISFNCIPATPTIYGSGNVSSITDNGTGDLRINFTTAMPDANYVLTCSGMFSGGSDGATPAIGARRGVTSYVTTSIRIQISITSNNTLNDALFVNLAVFR